MSEVILVKRKIIRFGPRRGAAARGTKFSDYRGKGPDGKFHHYVFVTEGTVSCLDPNKVLKLVSASTGSNVMPPAPDANQILRAITEALQSFNGDLASWTSLIKGLKSGCYAG